MRASGLLAFLAGLSILLTSCGPDVDLSKGLQVDMVRTGWLDAGLVGAGQNKLVPSVSFKLKNASSQKLTALQVNALFRRVSEKDEWGSGFVTAAGSAGLPPGGSSELLTINSQLGYTGSEPRHAMLQNSQFVDAKVDLFAKYGSTQWTKVGEYPIARQLLEH